MAGGWNGSTYFGDDTDEVATGTSAPENFYMNQGNDVANGAGGADYIDGGIGSDTLRGGAGDDVIFDINSYESGYTGLIGKDKLYGDEGDDKLHVASPDTNDVADGGAGFDTIFLNFHNEFSGAVSDGVGFIMGPQTTAYVGGIRTVAVLNCEQADITGGTGGDSLTGGVYDDSLSGMEGDDVLSGGNGDDVIDVGSGVFSADGGDGVDTFGFDVLGYLGGASEAQYDDITLALGGSFSMSAPHISGTATGFERLNVRTGSGADHLTGGALGDTIDAGDGADQVSGLGGADVLTIGAGSQIVACGSGNDTVYASNTFDGGDLGDVIDGEAGDDWMRLAGCAAGAGHMVDGGAGADLISANYQGDASSANTIKGGVGNDTITGGYGLDVIDGGAGNDLLAANSLAQRVTGGDGDDFVSLSSYGGSVTSGQLLDGGDGADGLALSKITVNGKLDLTDPSRTVTTDDGVKIKHFERFSLYYNAPADAKIFLGAGADTVDGGASGDVLIDGGAGNDTLYGRGAGAVVLKGGLGDDYLVLYATGGKSNGGDGNDRFVCYSGAQTVTGEAGADTFAWTSASYSTPAARDLIADFSHADGDRIDLSLIDAIAGTLANDAFTFVSQFHGVAGELMAERQSGKHYLVEADINGDGVADLSIEVISDAKIVAGDFIP